MFMYENHNRIWHPFNAGKTVFKIIFQAVPEPNITETILTESNPDVVYNLQDFNPNSFFMGTASSAVELFVVVVDGAYLCDFIIYTPDRRVYVQSLCSIDNRLVPSMPLMYSGYGSVPVYVTIQTKYSQAFAYFRNPECKFVF